MGIPRTVSYTSLQFMMNKYQTQLGKFWAKDLGPFRENGLDQDGVPTMKL